MSQLERRLGPFDAAAIVVSNVIGGGIFFVPILVAGLVPDARLLLVWLAGGVLAFFGAMAYAELAALRPRSGGEYVYLSEAYGPLAGFFTRWPPTSGASSPGPATPRRSAACRSRSCRS
jgi:APA family basic amino acid/polyamine antiporter